MNRAVDMTHDSVVYSKHEKTEKAASGFSVVEKVRLLVIWPVPASAIIAPWIILGEVLLLAWLDAWLPQLQCWWWSVLLVLRWLGRVAEKNAGGVVWMWLR